MLKSKFSGKYYSQEVIFKQPWEELVQALWQRYPNPYSRHVLSEDTYSRKYKRHQLITKRLITKTNPIPKWAEKAIGGETKAMFVEESTVDSKTKTLVTYNRNITQIKLLSMIEKCTYTISPVNPKWTHCLKQAWIQCRLFGIARVVEKFSIERYKTNAHKAEFGIQYVVNKMFKTANEVVKLIPP